MGPTSNGSGLAVNNGENTLGGINIPYQYGSLLLTGGLLNNEKPNWIRVNDTDIDTVILKKSGYDSFYPILLWKKLIAPTVVVEGYSIRIYNYNPVQVEAIIIANGFTWDAIVMPAATGDPITPSYTANIFIGSKIYFYVYFKYSDNSQPYSPQSGHSIGITEDTGFIQA